MGGPSPDAGPPRHRQLRIEKRQKPFLPCEANTNYYRPDISRRIRGGGGRARAFDALQRYTKRIRKSNFQREVKRTVNLIEALQVALDILGHMHREEGRPVNGNVGQTGCKCFSGEVPPLCDQFRCYQKRATALPMRCLRGTFVPHNGGFQLSVSLKFTMLSKTRCAHGIYTRLRDKA